MKLSRRRPFAFNYTALAFLLPVVGMLCVRLICALVFDGEFSMLYSDAYHQYYPFFKAYRTALRSGESLLFNWNVGMGMDYLGLIAYYLASPLNLLTALLPESWMMGCFSLLMPLKLGFAGLFFAILLKKLYSKEDLSISLFACFYAFCAWALGYQWNIMWLDSFALLPLVVLGMIRLLQDRKFLLYTFSLFLAVIANYYIGFFVCIFILLVFICYEICRWESFKKFLADLMWMALCSALAIGMTAILTLPAYSALQDTQSSVNKFPSGFRLNIAEEDTWLGLLDAMRQVAGNMNGCIEPTYKEGLPNLYCGVIANLLAILFLFSKEVKLRDKLCSVALLLFFNVSFIIRQLDYIWHGFHFTNMIPYRFSFLYSFVLLYMAHRAWLHRKEFQIWQILVALGLSFGLVFCSDEIEPFILLITGRKHMLAWIGQENILYNLETIATSCSYFAYNLLFLAAYGAALLFGCCKPGERRSAARIQEDAFKRQYSRIILLAVMGLELLLNLVSFAILFPATNISNYPMGKDDTAAVIEYMHQTEADNLFYRAETSHSQTLNDGALNGYNGISAFTSSANVKTTEFMKALGYGAKNTFNRYCFEDASPVSNLFLNLKYMIERKSVQDNPYFTDVCSVASSHLLENEVYLPLGFLTNAQILNVDFSAGENTFLLQNDLMRKATGINRDCWEFVTGNNVTIHGSDLTLTSQNQTGYCSYEAGQSSGKVTFRYTADRPGLLCYHVDQTKRNSFSVYLNENETALYSETYSLPQSLSACYVQPGDEVSITFKCAAEEAGTINVTAAILNDQVFRQCYDALAASTLELTAFSSDYVEGTILCDRDGVLYTSIPQDGNWTATVDGQPAQIICIGDVMVGLNLSEGEHTVAFRYENNAFRLGWKVSLLSFVFLCGLYYWHDRPTFKPTKGRYQK